MEFYESTYFIVLFPIVVITALLLFFWLFMKETSYDEVLAKQKKDQKLPPAKIDKKKTDKKKNKKKETQNDNLHESDSETAMREFDLGDALSSEEEHVVPAPIIPAETTGSVRERKKKEKKLPKPVAKEPVVKEPVNKEVNGTKVPVKKPEPVPVTKQPTPPPETTGSKKKAGPKKQKNGQDDTPVSPEPKNEQVVPSKKQESVIPMAEVKPQESAAGKKTAPKKKQKIENLSGLVDEPLIQPMVYIPLMDNSETPLVEKKEVLNFEKAEIQEVTQKSGGKKGKNVTDKGEHKENAEVKFKDLVATLRSMIFSDDEAMSVVEMLKDKSGSVKDLVHKANKGSSAAALQIQEKEKLLSAARDEAAIVKEQCKQLTQELVSEKQKLNLVEVKARERISILEKENGVFQSKLHSGFQDAQQMQVKFQQVREQLENQLAHLKQENGILRDAVSSATNQMESKQSNELIKLRQDYSRLVKELNDKNSSLAQEELQKKNQEQVVAGLKAQMQDAERRWEEVESYLRKRASEAEKAQQDFQSKFIAKEAEVQSLHSKLTDTMVSNQQLEQRIMQLLSAEDTSLQIQVQDLIKQNEALNIQIQKYHSQMQAQSSASVIVEELQKTIEEQEKGIKQMEESMSLERANFANSGEELKDLRKQNETLNIQIQKYISQIQAQATATLLVEELQKTIAEKDKEIKQVKDAMALDQANIANSGEELKTLQRENISLKAELQKIQALKSEQQVASQAVDHLERSIAEKDEKIRVLEQNLEAQLHKVNGNIQEHKALQSQNNELQVQVKKLQEQLLDQANKELLGQMEKSIQEKDEKIKTVEELLETGLIQVANKEEELRMLRDENSSLRMDVQNLKAQHNDQVTLSSVVEDLKNVIHEKDGKIRSVEDLLQAEQLRADNETKTVQALTKEIEALKEALGNSQREKADQVSSIAQVQDLQTQLKEKEETLKKVEERFNERESLLLEKQRQIEDLLKESSQLKIHIEEVQHRLQQQDSESTGAQDLQRRVEQQEQKIRDMEAIILEREKSVAGTTQELKGLKKENEILKIQANELQKIHDQQLQQVSSLAQTEELLKALAEKDRYITQLSEEVESQKAAVEQQRKKNNDLREKNWKAMEALASTEKMLQERVNKTAKEKQQNPHTGETDAREILQKIFPNVSVSASLHHNEWIQEFERLAKVCLNENGGSEKVKALEQKLKEGEEIHTLLKLECEKYKSVLAETEGILQRLQRSVEEEEGRWKLKLEESQNELLAATSGVRTLEQELDKLRRRNKEAESLLKEKENLETELEKAENERTTYVSEVRELKDLLTELQKKLDDSYSEAVRQNEELTLLKSQLNDTLKKLEVEQAERQKVASDVHEVQKSLDLLQVEILKGSGDSNVIDYSAIPLGEEDQERLEKMPRNLSQTVTQLQQRLQAVNQQLTKGRENVQIIG